MPEYRVQHTTAINVTVGDKVISGPFATDAEAWAWIDRQTIARPATQWRGCPQFIPIAADADFWRAWRDNPAAMKRDGYRVAKTSDGKWKAWIERGEKVTA